MMKKCLIFSAGDFSHAQLEQMERTREDLVIACDAGFAHCVSACITPDYVIGDFDSMKESALEVQEAFRRFQDRHPDRVLSLSVRKDDTDTMFAVKFAMQNGYREFRLFGMLGGCRFDHALANLQTLLWIRHQGGRGIILDASCSIQIAENETIFFPAGTKGYLSVIPVAGEARGVTLTGLSFPTQEENLFTDSTRGISNAFLPGKDASVSVAAGTLLLIVTPRIP